MPDNIVFTMKNNIEKNNLRLTLQKQRRNLNVAQREILSRAICQQVKSSAVFQAAQHIAFYTPVKGEASPLLLQENKNKIFYLPLLSSWKKHSLFFVKIDDKTQYRNNIYGIPEPFYQAKDIIPIEKLDLVITPLVAMDREGNRLGMGGGYYDRSFKFKKSLTHDAKPLLMGFAYDFQLVDILVAEKWDVPLNYLVTNKEFVVIE